jgi:putative phage-type endonuclease
VWVLENLNYVNNENIQALLINKSRNIKANLKYGKNPYKLDCDILIKTKNLDHNTWLKAKKLGISGTDVAAIARVNKYKSPMAIYLEKITDEVTLVENEKMYFGKILEGVVAKEFAKRNPNLKISKVNAVLKHKDYDFAIANIDRLIRNESGKKGILEVITASEYMKKYWKDDEIPLEYMMQLQWYMFVTGTAFGYFAILIGGNKYIERYVERDEVLIEMLKDTALDFWENNVLIRKAPDVDGSIAATEILNFMYPSSNELEIKLENNALQLINKREALKEAVEMLDTKVAECENKLKNLLQNNEVGIVEDKKVIWKNYKRTSFNSKALQKEEPEVYKKYLKESNVRKFEIR